jgi:hypothetical protein
MAAIESAFHHLLGDGEVHQAVNWKYANAAARTAASGFVATDLYKEALDLDTFNKYMLVGISPITWVFLGGGGGGGSGSYPELTGLTAGQPLRATGTTTVGFGALDLANANAITGILPAASGGTGVNNATRTLTINTNGGTLAFASASSTLTIPQTGTAALLGIANLFSARQDIRASGDGIAAGLHVPWITGDMLPTLVVGAATSGNNDTAIEARSYTGRAIYAESRGNLVGFAGEAILALNNEYIAVSGVSQEHIGVFGGSAENVAGYFKLYDFSLSAFGSPTPGNSSAPVVVVERAINDRDATGNLLEIVESSGGTGTHSGHLLYAEVSAAEKFRIERTGKLVSATTTAGFGAYTVTVPASLTLAGIDVANVFTVAQSLIVADAGTNTATTLLTLGHNTSSTPATSYGASIIGQLESSTTESQDAIRLAWAWTDATHATRTSQITLATVLNGTLTDRVKVDSSGLIVASGVYQAPDGAVGTPSYTFTSDPDTGFWRGGNNAIAVSMAGVEHVRFSNSSLSIRAGSTLSWNGTGGGSADLALHRDTSNSLAQRNGTSAQTHRLYGTYTDASNYERLSTRYESSTFKIEAEAAGTGTLRDLLLGTKFKITAAGSMVAGTAALGTTATDGFLYIPTCAGTPTGTPTSQTGTAALVYDTTNNVLHVYSGGAWRTH